MTLPRSAADVLSDHVTFEVECIDRMYLNVYQPWLQHGGGVAVFFVGHRGNKFPSTALMDPMTKSFVADIHHFTEAHGLDLVHFGKERKDDLTQRYLAGFPAGEGVLYVGRRQEKAVVWSTQKRRRPDGTSYAWLVKTSAMVNHFYLCALDLPYVFMARFSIRAGSPGYTGTDVVYPVVGSLRRAGWRGSIGRSQFLQIRPGAWLKASGTVSLRLSVKSAPSIADPRCWSCGCAMSSPSSRDFVLRPQYGTGVVHRHGSSIGSSPGGTTLIIHIVTAVNLIISLTYILADPGGLKAALRKEHPALTAAQVSHQYTLLILGGIAMGVVVIALWLWMARANGRGRNWARILSTVLFVLATLELTYALFGFGVVFGVTALGLIVPALTWLVGLAAVWLLWRSASSAFFKPQGFTQAGPRRKLSSRIRSSRPRLPRPW